MQRSSFPWFWVVLAAVVLFLPGTAGRLLLDVLGGVTLLLVLLPLLAAGAGFLAWRVLRTRLNTCSACGATSFEQEICPVCGSPLVAQTRGGWPSGESPDLEPGQVTIDVEAVDVPPGQDSDRRLSS